MNRTGTTLTLNESDHLAVLDRTEELQKRIQEIEYDMQAQREAILYGYARIDRELLRMRKERRCFKFPKAPKVHRKCFKG